MKSGFWQHIDTAPKNGTDIIGWELSREVHVMSWWSAERCVATEGGEPEDYQEGWYDSDENQMAPRFWIPYRSPLDSEEDDLNFYRMKVRWLEAENAYLKEQLTKAKADLLLGDKRTK